MVCFQKRKQESQCSCQTASTSVQRTLSSTSTHRTSRQINSPFGPLKLVDTAQGSKRTFRQTQDPPSALTQRYLIHI